MGRTILRKVLAWMLALGAIGLAGCGGGGGGAAGSGSSGTGSKAAALLLSASPTSIKTDGSTSTTITATVMDANNAALAGETVNFAASTGQLGLSSGVSSTEGVVTIPFSAVPTSGTGDRTNRTETITATVVGTGVTAQIPIQITGSTLTLTASQSMTTVGGTASLTATAKDASEAGVGAQTIRVSIAASSTGAGTLSASSATTATNGSTSAVTLTGTAPGDVVVNAEWLNAAGTATLTASTTIAVGASGVSFSVTNPATNPTSLALGASSPVTVSVPSTISGAVVANVRFATTLGTWSDGSKARTVAPAGNAASETLAAGAYAGTASVQIDALGSAGTVLATLNRTFTLSSVSAASISLQPSVSTVAPSTAGTTNSVTLTATVRDSANNSVANVPVLFEMVNPSGSGEQINPAVAYSNSSGQATATFIAGALPTTGGLQIKASVVGTAISDTKTINVSGTAVSVTLGASNMVASTNNDTTYTKAISVLVVSNTGAAISGATVTLSAFPAYYYRGTRDEECAPVYTTAGQSLVTSGGKQITQAVTTAFPNEDANENDILDAGEEYDPIGDGRSLDGAITPSHSAAGTLPATVVTDANGVGTFNFIYQKSYAHWITSRIRAKVVVTGTEYTNELNLPLPAMASEMSSPCSLPSSPFGP